MTRHYGPQKRTRQDKRTAALMFVHQHPRPDALTPEQVHAHAGCGVEVARELLGRG